MGLLDQLWDDTVAGPTPDTGLGKLRKYSTFSFRSNSGNKEVESVARSNSEDLTEEMHRNVTRSIMIKRPGNLTIGNDGGSSAPASPAGSTPPVSPFTPSGSPFSDYRRRMFTKEEQHPRHQQQSESQSQQQQQQQQQWGMDPGAHLLLTTCEM